MRRPDAAASGAFSLHGVCPRAQHGPYVQECHHRCRRLRAAAGPAFYASTFEAGATDTNRGLGVVGELAVALPRRSRVFGELLAQYRRVGSVEAGPLNTSANPVSTLPATEVNMNHGFVGLGVGARF